MPVPKIGPVKKKKRKSEGGIYNSSETVTCRSIWDSWRKTSDKLLLKAQRTNFKHHFFPTMYTQQSPSHPSPRTLLRTSHTLTSGDIFFLVTFIFLCEACEPSASAYPACTLNLQQCCMFLFFFSCPRSSYDFGLLTSFNTSRARGAVAPRTCTNISFSCVCDWRHSPK